MWSRWQSRGAGPYSGIKVRLGRLLTWADFMHPILGKRLALNKKNFQKWLLIMQQGDSILEYIQYSFLSYYVFISVPVISPHSTGCRILLSSHRRLSDCPPFHTYLSLESWVVHKKEEKMICHISDSLAGNRTQVAHNTSPQRQSMWRACIPVYYQGVDR